MSIPFAWMVSFIVVSILNLWFVVRANRRVRPYNNHYRIQIDPDINPLESSLLLYEEVLKSRTSVYVCKYLDSTYLTEEFVKNRLGQLETLKAITHEAGDNIELLVSIANEPADWILSFNEFLDYLFPLSFVMSIQFEDSGL